MRIIHVIGCSLSILGLTVACNGGETVNPRGSRARTLPRML